MAQRSLLRQFSFLPIDGVDRKRELALKRKVFETLINIQYLIKWTNITAISIPWTKAKCFFKYYRPCFCNIKKYTFVFNILLHDLQVSFGTTAIGMVFHYFNAQKNTRVVWKYIIHPFQNVNTVLIFTIRSFPWHDTSK